MRAPMCVIRSDTRQRRDQAAGIQNTGAESYIADMVKNAGNTDPTNVIVIVTLDGTSYTTGDGGTIAGDKDKLFAVAFADRLNSRVSATVNEKIFAGLGTTADAVITLTFFTRSTNAF